MYLWLNPHLGSLGRDGSENLSTLCPAKYHLIPRGKPGSGSAIPTPLRGHEFTLWDDFEIIQLLTEKNFLNYYCVIHMGYFWC